MRYLLLLLFACAIAGCGGGESYFRLEEYGEGWKLNVKEEDETFRASWIPGENRSAKLVSYADAPSSGYYVVNTLFVEIDEDDNIVDGRLKRVVLPDFEQRSYYEQNAQWFRVLEGKCVLNDKLEGNVDVRCEGGYEFNASIEPLQGLEIMRPE